MTGALRVGFDIRPLAGASGRRGIGSYIRGLLTGMAGLEDTGTEIVLFGNGTEGDQELPSIYGRVKLTRPRRGITLWDQAAWPPLLARRRIGIFHSPFYAVPRLRPRACRVVQTVHDLTPLKIPGIVSARNERVFRANFKLARSADRIIVPSESTRQDVTTLLGIPGDSVVVIPEACDITPQEVAAADAIIDDVRKRLGVPEARAYLLHTGGHDRVKNLHQLLEAFRRLIRDGHDLDLVITGEHGAETGGLFRRSTNTGILDRVRFPGFVGREDLIALYRGAAALVYPSLAEGFGLPVVEAMTCGVPVVAAAAGALPEVGGGACLFVPPGDVDALTDAIANLLHDKETSGRLSREGVARAATFTWRETATRTLAVYRELAA